MTGTVATPTRRQEIVMTPKDKKARSILIRPIKPYCSEAAALVLHPLIALGFRPELMLFGLSDGDLQADVTLFRQGRRSDDRMVTATVVIPRSYGEKYRVYGNVVAHFDETHRGVTCSSAIEAAEAATSIWDAMMAFRLAPVPAEAQPA
jgi:hypothetical protein